MQPGEMQLGEMQHFITTPLGEMQFGEMQLSHHNIFIYFFFNFKIYVFEWR